MFGRWSRRAADDPEGHALYEAVRAELSGADDDTVRIVTAVAGLLGGVAYADRDYAEPEERTVRRELERVEGLGTSGIDAIVSVMREHIIDISTVQSTRYSRTLRELGDRDLRVHVLEMLVEVAAADGVLSNDEVTLLRNTATALGLEQSDYNEAQAKHREKLNVLR